MYNVLKVMFRATPAASEANVKHWGAFEIETYLR